MGSRRVLLETGDRIITARLMRAGEGMKGGGQSRSGGKRGQDPAPRTRRPRVHGNQGQEGGCCLLIAAFGVFFIFSKMKNDVFVGEGVRCGAFEENGGGVIQPVGERGAALLWERSAWKGRPEVQPRWA